MEKLQKILIPVDFSPVTINAVRYANGILEKLMAEVVLVYVNTHENPIIGHEISSRISAFEKKVLEDVCFSYEFEILDGNLLNELINAIRDHEADLVIIGSRGKRRSDLSLASALIRSVYCPVIVVPEHFKEYRIHKISFANDYRPIRDSESLKPLWEFALEFGAKVYLLHVNFRNEKEPILADAAESTLEYYLDSMDHEYVYMTDHDVEHAINHYNEQNDIDLLVILSRDHGRNQLNSEGRLITHLISYAEIPILALC